MRHGIVLLVLWVLASALGILLTGPLPVPAPYVWIGLAWFLAALYGALTGGRRTRAPWVGAAVLLLGLTAVESFVQLRRIYSSPPQVRFEGSYASSVYWRPRDDVLGYGPHAGVTVQSRKYQDGTLLYDVAYSINEHGLRRSSPREPLNREPVGCVLFFGGSFTFGEGVNDDEAMPYQVGLQSGWSYRIYNFGFHGYGLHQAVSALEHGLVERVVECNGEVFAILQSDVEQVYRSRGLTSWDTHGPRYVIDGDEVRYTGHFDDPPPAGWPEEDFRKRPARFPLFLEPVLSRWIPTYSRRDRELFDAFVLTAGRRVRELFPEAEVHLILRDTVRDPAVVDYLEGRGIAVHPITEILPDYLTSSENYTIPHDGHPNAAQHERIAAYVVEKILGETAGGNPS